MLSWNAESGNFTLQLGSWQLPLSGSVDELLPGHDEVAGHLVGEIRPAKHGGNEAIRFTFLDIGGQDVGQVILRKDDPYLEWSRYFDSEADREAVLLKLSQPSAPEGYEMRPARTLMAKDWAQMEIDDIKVPIGSVIDGAVTNFSLYTKGKKVMASFTIADHHIVLEADDLVAVKL